jgi:hypothetical protein
MDKTQRPVIAGVLCIISGAIWIIGVVLFALVVVGLMVGFGTTAGFALVRIWIFTIVLIFFGIMDIVAGVLSLRRKKWLIALIGSIFAIPVGLGIAAVILIALSKKEWGN